MGERNRRALGGLILLALFISLVIYIPALLEAEIPEGCIHEGTCPHEEYLQDLLLLIPALIILGFVFGVFSSYFYFEKRIDALLPSADIRSACLAMLPQVERKVVGKVIDNGGKVLQSEVSRIEGIGKVKAHRVVERLMKRGVLEKEQLGKTNMLRLRKEIMDAFSEES
jgi:hypothetical protein